MKDQSDLPFCPLIDGQISEAVTLADHRLQFGLLHIEGAGLRVAVWNGARLRHMAQAAARRWARELEGESFAAAYTPVIKALRTLADRVDAIEAMVAANRAAIDAGLGEMAAEGRA